jgi:replicative DNA helicase
MSHVLPSNLNAEQTVLGSILIDNDALLQLEQLQPSHFYKQAHRVLYAAMLELMTKRTSDNPVPIDHVSLTEILGSKLEEVGGIAYIVGLPDTVPTSVFAGFYGQIVLEKAMLRATIQAAQKAQQLAYEEAAPAHEIVERTAQAFAQIAITGSPAQFQKMEDVTNEVIEDALSGTVKMGIPFGFIDLDECTLGMQGSQLIIIAAASGLGKTAFALDIAINASIKFKQKIGFITLEMPAKQLVLRAVAREARIKMQNLRRGLLSGIERNQIAQARARIAQAPIIFDDFGGFGLDDMIARIRAMVRRDGCGAIIVDYLQLCPGARDAGSREQEVASISRAFKRLSLELNVPIVALSQINDEHLKTPTKRPSGAHNLRESRAIWHDADLVLFLHRASHYDPNTPKGEEAEVIVAKQRNGPLETIKLHFHKDYVRFNELQKTPIDAPTQERLYQN